MTINYRAQVIGILMILCSMHLAPIGQAHAQGVPLSITPSQQALLDTSDAPDNTANTDSKVSAEDGDKRTVTAAINEIKTLPFCVLRAFQQGLGWMRIFNYTTTSVGTCDVKSIDSLTAASARAQMATLGAFDSVLVQGPYYHTMDVNKTQVNNPYISLGNLRFSEVGRSDFTLFDALKDPGKARRLFSGDATYSAIRTSGSVNFIWFSGSEIYVLTSNEGTQFVMTGVIGAIAFGQNGIRLKNLGQFLNLPAGWSFKAMRLNRVLSLNSSMLAGVEVFRLGDEFGNIYLQLPITDRLSQMADSI